MSIIDNAKAIAKEAHFGVKRKWGDDPYIVHPERVAKKVASLEGTDDIDVAAALLHDVVEDTEEQSEKERYMERIEKECGAEVLSLVLELTFPTEGKIWKNRPRAEKNVVREKQMRRMSLRARRIKMVDRWDNLNDMENAPYNLIRKTVDESWRLLQICGIADDKMAAELKNTIQQRAKTKRK